MNCPTQGKRMYASHRAAIGSALSASRKRGVALRVYYHPACKHFHLTKRPAWDVVDSSSEVA